MFLFGTYQTLTLPFLAMDHYLSLDLVHATHPQVLYYNHSTFIRLTSSFSSTNCLTYLQIGLLADYYLINFSISMR